MKHGTTLGLTCLALAALLAVLPARPAEGTREYARNEGKDCSHCHINDKGSGPRSENGREYEANGYKFGVKSWSTPESEQLYLRARAALMATWYHETARILDDLEKTEELPGGQALIAGTRKRYQMFPRTYLRNAKKLLGKGDRGLPNALKFLTRLETQFPETKEGKEAIAELEKLAADPKRADAVKVSREKEQIRLELLRGRTAYQLGDFALARKLLETVSTSEHGKEFEESVKEILADLPADE